MTYKEAHDWCLKNEATVYFHPKETLNGRGIKTIGRVQFMVAAGGGAGDTLISAIESWVQWQGGEA